jgi:uncharacterized protein (TIGR03083 family)
VTTTPAGPVDVRAVLRTERALFLDLLRSLDDAQWHEPTECPAYDVQGVATHILGDDFSLLSRQRDAAPSGLIAMWGPGDDLPTVLNRFNDRWVEAAQFFSPALLIDLLERTGEWTADWYDAVDPEELGEPVGFFGATSGSPYWQISAREYVERWVHHHQIRRALAMTDLDTDEILLPATASVMRATAAHLGPCGAEPGDMVSFTVARLARWTLRRDEDAWSLLDGTPDDVTIDDLSIDRTVATTMMSRAMDREDVEIVVSHNGFGDLAPRVRRGVAVIAGRPGQ